jgi:hypothetical protein
MSECVQLTIWSVRLRALATQQGIKSLSEILVESTINERINGRVGIRDEGTDICETRKPFGELKHDVRCI